MDAAKMYIHLFDSFTIEYQGEILNMREHLSRQSLSLLEVSGNWINRKFGRFGTYCSEYYFRSSCLSE